MTRIIDEEKWLTKMNKEYAVVMVKNRVKILMEKDSHSERKIRWVKTSLSLDSNYFLRVCQYYA